MSKIKETISKINENIAVKLTILFSSMTCFYLFFIWGLLGLIPGIPDHFKTIVMLVSSSWIQLFALPLISVGQRVLGKSAEMRAESDHNHLIEMQQFIHDHMLEQDELLHEIRSALELEEKPKVQRILMKELANSLKN